MSPLNPSPEEIRFLMECGYLCCETGRYQEARDIFSGVQALLPKSDAPAVALGTVYFAERDLPEAIRCYRQALSRNPASAYAHVHLGEALFFQGDKSAARPWLRKAIELEPGSEIEKLARMLLEIAREENSR